MQRNKKLWSTHRKKDNLKNHPLGNLDIRRFSKEFNSTILAILNRFKDLKEIISKELKGKYEKDFSPNKGLSIKRWKLYQVVDEVSKKKR